MINHVSFNLSPRFTEECFATLIALIFIKEAFKKLIDIIKTHPLHEHPVVEPNQDLIFPYDKQYLHCECLPPDPKKVTLAIFHLLFSAVRCCIFCGNQSTSTKTILPFQVDDNHTIHQWLTDEWVEPDLDDWHRTYTDPSLYQVKSALYIPSCFLFFHFFWFVFSTFFPTFFSFICSRLITFVNLFFSFCLDSLQMPFRN